MDAMREQQGLVDLSELRLDEFAERKYLDYAVSVVKGRALPLWADGLKPVHRRILYAMHTLGIAVNTKHRKVAMVVGETLGKYHPHGDTSISDALVRMAQEFSLRYPLIDGQGNFGSRDGDGAAAPRYIEARLTSFAELMLSELDLGTVDMIPNYEGTYVEPRVLPARLPFVLLNGCSGMAVGYATEIPSHNLREVVAATCRLMRDPDCTLDDLLEVVPAPDFPCGGQIIAAPAALRSMYESGHGSVRVRARWRREELARGQWQVVVYEMPHGTSTAAVLGEIEAAVNPQRKENSKDVTQEQKNLKQLLLSLLEGARDESCKDEPVRLVLEPKSARTAEDELMAALLVHTSLERAVPVNMVMIGADDNPRLKGLRAILGEWIGFRFDTVGRRLRNRLAEVERRLHILAGRAAVLLRLDEVIATIRDADEPKTQLIARFGLSELQAEDILDIRLRQLARLEFIKLERETAELREEQARISHLLATPEALRELILSELEADARRYGDDRRSLVQAVKAVRPASIAVADEAVTLFVSRNGWARARAGHAVERAAVTYRQGDGEGWVLESRTTWPLIVLDSNGRAYSVRTAEIPGGRGDGVLLSSLIELQPGENGMGQIAHVLAGRPEDAYLFSNSGGYGFITSLDKLVGRQKAGKEFMRIDKGEVVLAPTRADGDTVAAVCAGGKQARMLLFARGEMKVMPGGRGVQVMGLGEGDALVLVRVGARAQVTLHGGARTLVVGGAELEKYCMRRARKGVALPVTMQHPDALA